MVLVFLEVLLMPFCSCYVIFYFLCLIYFVDDIKRPKNFRELVCMYSLKSTIIFRVGKSVGFLLEEQNLNENQIKHWIVYFVQFVQSA